MKESENSDILEIRDLNVWYGETHALTNINMGYRKNSVNSLIGPSGCGKSTLIRCLNRINDIIPSCRVEGEIIFHGKNILDKSVDPVEIRRRIGMVFQKPNPFPKSIYENVAYGLKVQGEEDEKKLDRIVERSLKCVGLWDEVQDRLDESATEFSGGQQQRLCIARAIAIEPDIILMDEPCSALDPISTSKIEDLMNGLKKDYTVIIVTHNMQQAARVSDYTGFMYLGKLIEYDETKKIFENPQMELTEKYITGRFG